MKIAIGALLCEGNSLTPVKTRFENFDYAPGAAMYEKVAVLDLLQARNCEIVPTLYAHALPGGPVVQADYLRLANEILEGKVHRGDTVTVKGKDKALTFTAERPNHE